jgi:hypothetical protein
LVKPASTKLEEQLNLKIKELSESKQKLQAKTQEIKQLKKT